MIKLKPELIANLDSLDGLQAALQQAIVLEHSTIPTYLYAAYSIIDGQSETICNLIKSVVIEEMLHLGLACNILNAIGGSPNINTPGFIPTYSGPLPGGVETGLIVPLAPLSSDLLKNTFMEIEEPENPWDFPATNTALEPEYITIGGFYGAIKTQIYQTFQAGTNIFKGDKARQVDLGQFFPDVPTIYDAYTAMRAIDLIVDQGEGTSTSPDDPEQNLAHYYRFAEIYYGNTLIPNPNPPPNPSPNQMFVYGGAALSLDPKGVQPLIENPKASNYPPGTPVRQACDDFNSTYTGLLDSLHNAFNGSPSTIGTAVDTMFTLAGQAKHLMTFQFPSGAGTYAGPSFEYTPSKA